MFSGFPFLFMGFERFFGSGMARHGYYYHGGFQNGAWYSLWTGLAGWRIREGSSFNLLGVFTD